MSWLRNILLALAAIAGPILYILGVRRGEDKSDLERLEQELARERHSVEFYRQLEQYQNEISSPVGRDDIAERLRKTGL